MARPAFFTPVVATVSSLCGLAVLAYFGVLLVHNPTGFALGVLVALLPLAGLLTFYTWLDSYAPEPRHLLVAAVLWGGFAATGTALVINTAAEMAIGGIAAVIEAPWVEEGMKGLFLVLLLIWRRNDLNGILNGVVYAGFVAAGFAFTENITYFAAAYDGANDTGDPHFSGIPALLITLLMRGVITPFAHPLFTSMTGIGIGLAATTRQGWVRWLAPLGGYLVAVFLHGSWNGSLSAGIPLLLLVAFFGVYAPAWSTYLTVCVLLRRSARTTLSQALGEAAGRGLVPAADVPWVVDPHGRRTALKYARAYGGEPGAATMRSYQRALVRFGFLYHRVYRQAPPPDYTARGNTLLAEMARLRPYLAFPPTWQQ